MAIDLAVENVEKARGGPFGAVIVKNGTVIATGVNLVTTGNDPTAHAEVSAIRAACQALKTYQLIGCELYTTCEPCPMCLGAIYWARLDSYYFASSRHDAAQSGFDDEFIYCEVALAPEMRSIPGRYLLPEAGKEPFVSWMHSNKKITY